MRAAWALMAVAVWTISLPAAEPPRELLAKVPDGANALMILDVAALMASPVAQREGWAKKHSEEFQTGMSSLPPSLANVVVAGQAEHSSRRFRWLVGVVRQRNAYSVQDIARVEGATLSIVADETVARSPRDAFFASLGGKDIATFYPADRQDLARWLRATKKATVAPLSPALAKAAAQAATSPVVLALDATDAVDPVIAADALRFLPVVTKSQLDPARLGLLAASLTGVTFTAQAGEIVVGRLQLDFKLAVNAYAAALKDLVVERLDEDGIGIDEVRDWKATFTDTSMILEGPMASASLKRILGLMELPTLHESDAPTTLEPTASATRRYVGEVRSAWDTVRLLKPKDYNSSAVWYDNAARKIDGLSVRAADPQALQYGRTTANRLRAIAASLRGVPIQVDTLGQSATLLVAANGPSLFGGGVAMQTNIPEVRQQQAKVIAADEKKRSDVVQMIDADTLAVRQALSEKYKADF